MYLKSILYLGNIISQGGMITEAAHSPEDSSANKFLPKLDSNPC